MDKKKVVDFLEEIKEECKKHSYCIECPIGDYYNCFLMDSCIKDHEMPCYFEIPKEDE